MSPRRSAVPSAPSNRTRAAASSSASGSPSSAWQMRAIAAAFAAVTSKSGTLLRARST